MRGVATVLKRYEPVSTDEAKDMARRIAREEALFAGSVLRGERRNLDF